jgi:hypothetical protein
MNPALRCQLKRLRNREWAGDPQPVESTEPVTVTLGDPSEPRKTVFSMMKARLARVAAWFRSLRRRSGPPTTGSHPPP